LPDVLTDQQAERIDDEIRQDRVAADRGERGGVRRQFLANPEKPPVLYSAIGSRMKKIPMVLTRN
jgi:hypothetical protein